jgi:hypothetical protein
VAISTIPENTFFIEFCLLKNSNVGFSLERKRESILN